MEGTVRVVEPQSGYQVRALSSAADIVIGGGAAGSGKTYSLLLEFLRHISNPGWGGVIFRRTNTQIRNEGALWDTSMLIYPHVGAVPKESTLEWGFKSGCRLKFSHLEHEKNILDWQGSQIPFIGFDELTHFSESMFFYLLSRNRSVCGVKPYVRATCNPDPESWVAKLIEWWINQETGFPIVERNGVIRYFVRYSGDYIWGDSYEEVIKKAWFFLEKVVEQSGIDPREMIKSITFVSGSVYENKELLGTNPGYVANLLAQEEQVKSQLLDGNWKIVISENDIYDYYALSGCFDDVYTVNEDNRYITADIALKGSNKFIVGYWSGDLLDDITIMDKSDGKQVVSAIEDMAKKHKVQNRHIVYDNDGVGGFIDGFISGAIPFHNGGTAMANPLAKTQEERNRAENYKNLKTQCYYRSGDRVNKGLIRISKEVGDRMYDDTMTVRQRFLHERKAIKRAKVDADGKLCIIQKEEMKAKLSGDSPDLLDMFMMREYFELRPPMKQQNLKKYF